MICKHESIFEEELSMDIDCDDCGRTFDTLSNLFDEGKEQGEKETQKRIAKKLRKELHNLRELKDGRHILDYVKVFEKVYEVCKQEIIYNEKTKSTYRIRKRVTQ